jgi:DNA polymerase III delta subunit
MRELIAERAAEKGLRLPPEVLEYLVAALGTDTGRIPGELEKLICYAGGPDRPVSVEDAEQVCPGSGEELPWALSNALGRRNLGEALRVIQVLLEQSRDEDQAARSLLGQTAKYFRELLQVKVFMTENGLGSPGALVGALQRLTPEQKQRCLADGLPVLAASAFRCKALAGDAKKYSGPDLVEAVGAVHDAYLKCLTSGTPERIALEEVVTRIAAPPATPSQQR